MGGSNGLMNGSMDWQILNSLLDGGLNVSRDGWMYHWMDSWLD